MTVGVLLLAAGSSRRFGTDKRYARLASGETILESCVRTVQDAKLPLLVCLPAGDTRTPEVLRQFRVDSYQCRNSARGIGATLAESIGQVTQWRGVIVGLADMPYIRSSSYRIVADQLESDGICVPRYGGEQGHPVGFGRLFFPALAGLSGDLGARKMLQQHPHRITYLDVSDSGILRDIDSRDDLP